MSVTGERRTANPRWALRFWLTQEPLPGRGMGRGFPGAASQMEGRFGWVPISLGNTSSKMWASVSPWKHKVKKDTDRTCSCSCARCCQHGRSPALGGPVKWPWRPSGAGDEHPGVLLECHCERRRWRGGSACPSPGCGQPSQEPHRDLCPP